MLPRGQHYKAYQKITYQNCTHNIALVAIPIRCTKKLRTKIAPTVLPPWPSLLGASNNYVPKLYSQYCPRGHPYKVYQKITYQNCTHNIALVAIPIRCTKKLRTKIAPTVLPPWPSLLGASNNYVPKLYAQYCSLGHPNKVCQITTYQNCTHTIALVRNFGMLN